MPEVSPVKSRRAAKRPATQADGLPTTRNLPSTEVINMTAVDRNTLIAEAAYYRAQRRDFEPGHELEDWLAAETEVDRALIARTGGETSA